MSEQASYLNHLNVTTIIEDSTIAMTVMIAISTQPRLKRKTGVGYWSGGVGVGVGVGFSVGVGVVSEVDVLSEDDESLEDEPLPVVGVGDGVGFVPFTLAKTVTVALSDWAVVFVLSVTLTVSKKYPAELGLKRYVCKIWLF